MKNKKIKPRVVIINGYPGSGKDTFAELCGEFAKVDNVLTSTPAKNALQLLGWNGEKTPEARDLLSVLIEASYEHFNGPVNYVMEKIEESDSEIIFVHVREPKNIDLFKEHIPGLMTLFIERDTQKQSYSNDSDNDVENYVYDVCIANNGTVEQLKECAEAFTGLVKKGWF